ncbi:Dhp1p-interacting protein Din1 [Schizosaccharomyces japonicus yFS275]|uniref:Decapping nuclease n=1 Tax=Schizosaccharomyces japonicus (strain yFS275 / FY16936) TaxID=402676 RepID=B6K2A6_SCHJY|nr:Dhp1p-interacting protein Din1 [Schizosaccharomyces japonicus yFS275]EEB07287.1 Dhp1p-interacting protein Din1 [Schizosaccharomyces japonicus yFS275]
MEFRFENVKPARTPAVAYPKEITCYSVDGNRDILYNDSNLRFYYPPPLGTDLNIGFPKRYTKPLNQPDSISIVENALLNNCKDVISSAEIVSWRGLLTKLLCAPVDYKSSWDILVYKKESTLFFEEPPRAPEKPYANQERMCFWGYKFETVSTLPKIWDECSRSSIEQRDYDHVNPNEQYCSIVKTSIGSHSMILGGEVDCVWDIKPDYEEDNPCTHYVELKVTKKLPLNHVGMRRKLIKYWAQSFLLGIPRIVVGFRDDNGVIVEIKEMSTTEIPKLLKPAVSRNEWTPSRLLVHLEQLLTWLKSIVQNDSHTSWKLSYRGQGSITLQKTSSSP